MKRKLKKVLVSGVLVGFAEMAMIRCLPIHNIRHNFEDQDMKLHSGKDNSTMNRFSRQEYHRED